MNAADKGHSFGWPLCLEQGILRDMSASQHHGFDLESLLLAEFPRRSPDVVLPSVALSHGYTARFDVSSFLDPYGTGIPTSIKTAKYRGPRTLICLADATRIVRLSEEPHMRLMVALYRQEGNEKVFSELREYVVTGEEWAELCGHVPPEDIEAFARDLVGRSSENAREQARLWKKDLTHNHPSAMRWNPKIDSKNQRRLQCSVPLQDLEAIIRDRSRIKVFGQAMDQHVRPGYLRPQSERLWGRGLRFPIRLASEARQRSPKVVAAPTGRRRDPVAASPIAQVKVVKVPRKKQAVVSSDIPKKVTTPSPKRKSITRR